MGKDSFQQIVRGQLVIHLQKNEVGSLCRNWLTQQSWDDQTLHIPKKGLFSGLALYLLLRIISVVGIFLPENWFFIRLRP